MNDSERDHVLTSIMLAIREQDRRIGKLESANAAYLVALTQISRRLQLQEAGVALYEMQLEGRDCH